MAFVCDVVHVVARPVLPNQSPGVMLSWTTLGGKIRSSWNAPTPVVLPDVSACIATGGPPTNRLLDAGTSVMSVGLAAEVRCHALAAAAATATSAISIT